MECPHITSPRLKHIPNRIKKFLQKLSSKRIKNQYFESEDILDIAVGRINENLEYMISSCTNSQKKKTQSHAALVAAKYISKRWSQRNQLSNKRKI